MSKMAMNLRDYGLLAAAGAFFLDQATKLAVLYGLGFIVKPYEGHLIEVLPFFNLVMAPNSGVSFGLFPATGPEGTALLALFSIAAVAALGWWLWRARRLSLTVGLGLVIGGALGNLVDRLVHGWVADFFDFHLGGYHWYVFNVADAAITFGVIALLYDALQTPDLQAGGHSA
jgi:signal peptidase II